MTNKAVSTLPEPSGIINVEDYTKAMLNILEDFAEEKRRLEETQRAMLNLLDDFRMEREKTEAVNRELRDAEKKVKISLQEKEALLKEIHHRVKNNLQIIHSMLNLQLAYIIDEQAIKMFKESKDRVYSMALIHEKLYQSESLAKIDLGEYITSLTANLFHSYGTTRKAIRQRINVEKVTLGVDAVTPCALIINELVSNSLKHAFPDSWECVQGKREIRVDLCRDTGNRFKLSVSDNGIGLPKGFEIQKCDSLGLKLVNVLVRQLKGTLHIDTNDRTEFVITFKPLK